MTKKEGGRKPLSSSLRRVAPQGEAVAPETETIAGTITETIIDSVPKRKSVLTPAATARPLSKKTKAIVVLMSLETEIQLKAVLEEASPFSGPLTLTNIIDLLYCEMVKTPEILERAKEKISALEMPPQDKRTSVLLKVGIDRFFQKTFKLSGFKASSKLVQWIVSDWPWIQPRLKYRGLKESSQATGQIIGQTTD